MISVCAYCGVGCEIDAKVVDNRIVGISLVKEGLSSGGKICIKGALGYDFAQSPDRLQKPLINRRFIKKNGEIMPESLRVRLSMLREYDESFYEAPFSLALDITAWKTMEILNTYGRHSVAGIGGARTSLENAWLFQKFIRTTLNSPNIDNCARVCHSPSLSGLMMSIGEGASSASFEDIDHAQTLFIIGSNTTEAHPVVARRIKKAQKEGTCVIAVDVRETALFEYADIGVVLPFEANLLFLNAIAKELVDTESINDNFIKNRCIGYEDYVVEMLNDAYNKEIFLELEGYEDIFAQIEAISERISTTKTLFLWGLGITEHLDGTNAVNAISNLAMLTGNFSQKGTGVFPLRGQNNVQGCCDVGCLPYYDPDYQTPAEIGLMTPDVIDVALKGEIKMIYNMGEDLSHIHANQNKLHKALESTELIVVQELFLTDIASKADIVFGVKSSYEKYGVYVNAERRLHLSKPLISNDLPDDWEVLQAIENRMEDEMSYASSEEIFTDLCDEVGRYAGATYERLDKKPLQWPIFEDGNDSPLLHTDRFSTPDGMGHFHYRPYQLRGMVESLLKGEKVWYLTTGRILHHYNNASQTKRTERLLKSYPEDILVVSDVHQKEIGEKVSLQSVYGKSTPLNVIFSKQLKPYTLYTTFHFAKSKINYLFGDEADKKVKTARFKSVEVEICDS